MREKLRAFLSLFDCVFAFFYPVIVVWFFFVFVYRLEEFISYPFVGQIFCLSSLGFSCWLCGATFVSDVWPAIKRVASCMKDLFKRPDAPVSENK